MTYQFRNFRIAQYDGVVVPAAEFTYVSAIRQIQYVSDWGSMKLRAEVDVKNIGSIAGLCTCIYQIACAEGGWDWKSHPKVSQLTIQPGEIATFVGDTVDSPMYGYRCKIRFTGDPGTTPEVTMI